jgi:hypothetical protein
MSIWRSIFKRLRQHGYEPEIEYFGYYAVKSPHMPFFKTSKPLTDKGQLSPHVMSMTRC